MLNIIILHYHLTEIRERNDEDNNNDNDHNNSDDDHGGIRRPVVLEHNR